MYVVNVCSKEESPAWTQEAYHPYPCPGWGKGGVALFWPGESGVLLSWSGGGYFWSIQDRVPLPSCPPSPLEQTNKLKIYPPVVGNKPFKDLLFSLPLSTSRIFLFPFSCSRVVTCPWNFIPVIIGTFGYLWNMYPFGLVVFVGYWQMIMFTWCVSIRWVILWFNIVIH